VIIRGTVRTSRGAHVRALAQALADLIDFLPEYPSHRRVALRDHLAALQRAYPELQNEVDNYVAHLQEDEP